MAGVVKRHSAGVILMHIKGTPRDMQADPQYDDVVSEIHNYLVQSVERFVSVGVMKSRIMVDPGIGFGKKLDHNLTIIRNLSRFQAIAAGVVYGPSRKSFIGALTGKPAGERMIGTLGSVAAGVLYGADIVRVHDVCEAVEMLKVVDAIRTGNSSLG